MSAPPRLQVDIWSDVACPWCWVGVLRYKQAVAKVAHKATVTTKFHPYMIDPATKKEGANISHAYIRLNENAERQVSHQAHCARSC